MAKLKKEKLIEKIYRWTAKDAKVGIKKERLLKIMIEATLDYLYEKEYLDVNQEERVNGEKD